MASPNRKDGGGLSMQTLAIASSASLAAALITSRLAPAGTVYTAALTPVIVAMVSEMLHRPVNRVTQLREARRTAVREPGVRGTAPPPRLGAPEPTFTEPGVRVHGQRRWGRIHPRVVIATGLAAFVVAAAALTLPEVLFGGAVANSHRTTIFGGAPKKKTAEQKTAPAATTETTTTETTPAQEPAPATTETTPTDTTPAETAPSGGTPAPGEPTTTGTTPAQTPPSG